MMASAEVTPVSGELSGGTVVTVQGIEFVEVSGGDSFTLGLTTDGTVFAWGSNNYGELGDGTTTRSLTPVQVKGVAGTGVLSGVTSISAGDYHSLALTASGVFAWGYNGSGELGDGTNADSLTPVQVGTGVLSGVTSISAGADHSFALTTSGVFAWGYNGYGQLGDGTTTSRSVPVQVLGVGGSGVLSGVTSISAGSNHSFALTASGVFAWGRNDRGQLGDGTTTSRSVPVQVLGVGGSGVLSGVTSISASNYHSLALTASGVFAWGDNDYGQLGDGTTTRSLTPVQVLGVGGSGVLSGVTSISAGNFHSLALTASGVFAWGRNSYGQLGDGTTTRSLTPVQVKDVAGTGVLSGVTSISASNSFSLALTASGVFAWGVNFSGQFGDGTVTAKSTPVLGANFQPVSVTFGGVAGTNLSDSGSLWSVTVPSGALGPVDVLATANVFGGTTPGSPPTVTWNAGTFTYAPAALASTGVPNETLPTGMAILVLGLGLLLTMMARRRKTLI